MRALFQSRLRHGKLFQPRGRAYSSASMTIAMMQHCNAAAPFVFHRAALPGDAT
jgi:hypothetical protein